MYSICSSQPCRTMRDFIYFGFVTKKQDGRLERCKATNTCPKIFEANSANEFWAKAASNLLTDAKGHDLNLKAPVTLPLSCAFGVLCVSCQREKGRDGQSE
ncbi:MAG TPA: hypothetical protein VH600_15285 [Burkholderiales bacterium]|jgi:hypothetical protein